MTAVQLGTRLSLDYDGEIVLSLDGYRVARVDGTQLSPAQVMRIKHAIDEGRALPELYSVVVESHGGDRAQRLAEVGALLAGTGLDGRLLVDRLIACRPTMPPGSRQHLKMDARIGSLAGANSIDRFMRRPAKRGVFGYGSWWPQEQITDEDADRLIELAGDESLSVFLGDEQPSYPALVQQALRHPPQHMVP